jgi:hypothetical protein
MTRRRQTIPRRTPVFLGCEGESERAYGQFLNAIARNLNRPIAITIVNLNPGAGDPAARIHKAVQEIARRKRNGDTFVHHAILMDTDQLGNDPARLREITSRAGREHIFVIWQEPCHEALLLRHFDGHATRRPPTSAEASKALREVWPGYQKPAIGRDLSTRLNFDDILRAAANDTALDAFLRRIGLIRQGE